MPKQCRAAIATGDGTFVIDDILVHDPAGDEVVVQMKAASLCHTDYDSLSWGKPVVMGHEGAGVVAAIGSDVNDLKNGDRVILNWAMPCMSCFQCQAGNEHICEQNSPVVAGGNGYTAGHATLASTTWQSAPIERSFNIGTLSEYTLVKRGACVRIDDMDIPWASASVISCGVMTGYGSVANVTHMRPGDSAVVIGTGGVGLNVIQACKIRGASKIIAIDVNPHRLELARSFGATHIVLADKCDTGLFNAAAKIKTMTDGRGADYAFECTAVPALGAAPLAMIRNAGTAVQVSGIEEEITIDMRLFEWDKIYVNPLYGKCRPQIDFPILMDLYKDGSLKLDELITRTYPLEHLQSALDDMLSGANAKGVIVF